MHAGKTFSEVERTNPSYIEWAKKNAPNLLKESKPKNVIPRERKEPKEDSEVVKSSLQPNLDFLNQKNEYNK